MAQQINNNQLYVSDIHNNNTYNTTFESNNKGKKRYKIITGLASVGLLSILLSFFVMIIASAKQQGLDYPSIPQVFRYLISKVSRWDPIRWYNSWGGMPSAITRLQDRWKTMTTWSFDGFNNALADIGKVNTIIGYFRIVIGILRMWVGMIGTVWTMLFMILIEIPTLLLGQVLAIVAEISLIIESFGETYLDVMNGKLQFTKTESEKIWDYWLDSSYKYPWESGGSYYIPTK